MLTIDVKEVIHEVTEYPIDYIQSDFHLESDLGIDSIKKIMIVQKLTANLTEEMQDRLLEQYSSNDMLQASTVQELEKIFTFSTIKEIEKDKFNDLTVVTMNVENKEECEILKNDVLIDVKEVIHEVTEYPKDYIQSDFHLESDLGIDSIKKIMIVQKLTANLSETMQDRLLEKYSSNDMLQASTVQELEEIFDFSTTKEIEKDEINDLTAVTMNVEKKEECEILKNNLLINVKEIIHEVTEYPLDYIQSDFHLESDLGIDSIKKIMIVQKLTANLSEAMQDHLLEKYSSNDMLQASTVQELEEIFNYVTIPDTSNIESNEKSTKNEEPSVKDEVFSIKKLVSKITNIKDNKLNSEDNLESDLGMTSVQKISLINMMLESIEEDEVDNLIINTQIEQLLRLETIGDYEEQMKQFLEAGNENRNNIRDFDLLKPMMSNSQYLFLLSCWTATLSLASKVTIKGKLDLKRLKRAWKIIVEKQPSLQTYFQCEENAKRLSEYEVKLYDRDFNYDIPIHDLRSMHKINQDAHLEKFINGIINGKFEIYTYPLHQIYVFQLSDNEFSILIGANHLIVDGLGIQKTLRDLVNIYDQLLDHSYSKIEEEYKTITIAEYQKNLQCSAKEILSKEGIVSAAKDYRFPVSKKAGNGIYGNMVSAVHQLSKADTMRLKKVARDIGASLYSVVVSAYLLAIQSIDTDTDYVTLNLPTSGKIGETFDLTDITGCFAQNLSIEFDRLGEGTNQLTDYIQYVQHKINVSLVNQEDLIQGKFIEQNVVSQDLLEKKQLKEYMINLLMSTLKSNVYLSYIGDAKFKTDYKNIEITDYDMHSANRRDTVDILVEFIHDKFLFSINYDLNAYNTEDIQLLYDRMKLFLMKFVTMPLDMKRERKEQQVLAATIPTHKQYNEEVATVVESIICEVSGLNKIDRDKAVELVYGISSIEKMKILTKLLEQFEIKNKVKLFQFQTVNELIDLVQEGEGIQTFDAYPCAPAQKWLFNYFHNDCRWGGYSRFTYNGELDTTLLEKALQMLIRQNSALRMKFDTSKSPVMAIFEENAPIDIKYMRLQENLGREEFETHIQKLMYDELSSFDILQLPLFKVRIIVSPYGKDNQYEFIIIGSHTILDMVSNNLLFKQMWENYSRLLNHNVEKNIPLDHSFKDFIIETSNDYNKNKNEYIKYWSNKYKDFTQTTFDFYKTNESNDEKDEQTVEQVLSERKTKALQQYCSTHKGISFYQLLLEPLYRCISEVSKTKNVTISHRSHGRVLGSQMFMDIAGNFAVNFPVMVTVDCQSREELLDQISKEQSKVPLNGVSYDLVGHHLSEKIYPDQKLTVIRANYLGYIDGLVLPSAFEFDQQHMNQRLGLENQQRISEVEFFFSIENNQLQVKIAYPGKKCTNKEMDNLLEQYLEYLEYFIEDTNIDAMSINSKVAGNERIQEVAVITGGSSGIGKATAEKYLANGYQVALIARNKHKLEACKEELGRKFNKDSISIYSADITNYSAVEEVRKSICQDGRSIGTLICCAGITLARELLNCTPEQWINIVQVNLIGTFNTLHQFVPVLKDQQKGSIVIVGSDSSHIAYPLMSAYASAKHGLVGLTGSLAEEIKRYEINVNLICPAPVDTDMVPPSWKEFALKPAEVADVIYQYTQKEMATITGTVVKVNGKKDMSWISSEDARSLSAIIEMQ